MSKNFPDEQLQVKQKIYPRWLGMTLTLISMTTWSKLLVYTFQNPSPCKRMVSIHWKQIRSSTQHCCFVVIYIHIHLHKEDFWKSFLLSPQTNKAKIKVFTCIWNQVLSELIRYLLFLLLAEARTEGLKSKAIIYFIEMYFVKEDSNS